MFITVFTTAHHWASFWASWILCDFKFSRRRAWSSDLSSRMYCRPDYGGSTNLWNVGRQLFYTAVHSSLWWWRQHVFPKRRSTIILHGSTLIALMLEGARTSETSVDNYFTRQYIPEDKSELHTSCRENLKSHVVNFYGEATLHFIRRFESLTHRPDDGGSTYLWNVSRQLFYTAVHSRRQI
jgi:hypothetical protein